MQARKLPQGTVQGEDKSSGIAEFARRFGVEELLNCLERNEKSGIVYHREGIIGDYDDFDDIEKLINFIKTGEK